MGFVRTALSSIRRTARRPAVMRSVQVLRSWGWARPRDVHGLAGLLRPRRARCPGCLITHVLLPLTVLTRRAYAGEVIGAALTAR
jgi:hypothetical protein